MIYNLNELAHPQIIRTIGEVNTWRRLDAACLKDLQTIRDAWYKRTGAGVYCNRLNIGLDSRGLRPPNDPDGSFYSTHKQGNTFDLEPVKGTVKQLYRFIKDMIADDALMALNTLEDIKFTPGWVHVAKMNTYKKPLIINL